MNIKLEDLIPGRKADNIPDTEFDANELAMGIKVEMEHTDDPAESKRIAKEHLLEDPKYYTKLDTAGLADELEESQVGDLYIQIGEAIETIESGCEELAKVLRTPDPNNISQEFREIENIRSSILKLKEMYSDGYDFNM